MQTAKKALRAFNASLDVKFKAEEAAKQEELVPEKELTEDEVDDIVDKFINFRKLKEGFNFIEDSLKSTYNDVVELERQYGNKPEDSVILGELAHAHKLYEKMKEEKEATVKLQAGWWGNPLPSDTAPAKRRAHPTVQQANDGTAADTQPASDKAAGDATAAGTTDNAATQPSTDPAAGDGTKPAANDGAATTGDATAPAAGDTAAGAATGDGAAAATTSTADQGPPPKITGSAAGYKKEIQKLDEQEVKKIQTDISSRRDDPKQGIPATKEYIK